jgi:SNF2 family DNA or RNA helicase
MQVPECPLLQLHWWRLILDEAQMVGSGLSQVAVMADRLSAVHRWCVTGTPIREGQLDDVAGLLRTLKYVNGSIIGA